MNWKPVTATATALWALAVWAQEGDNTFAQYREMFGDDNPAELVEFEGEILWAEPGGPNNVSLEQCDLGLGAGVVEGAYAELPRYFEDTDQVMDLELRLVHCMVTLQGRDRDALMAKPFSEQGQPQTDLEKLSAYIAGLSRDVPVAVPQDHPKERQAYAVGEKMFTFRAGPYDFSCATCHAQSDKRIRLQALPNLTEDEGARNAYTTWPGYRISQGAVRTMEWRVGDCFRQQRLPELVYGSEVAIGLITYMGVRANGALMAAPGLKR
jgi:L-cysteine S-thiosulfotransferase